MRIGLFTDQPMEGISGLVTSLNMLYKGIKAAGHECFIFTTVSNKGTNDNPDIIEFPGLSYPVPELKEYKFVVGTKKYVDCVRQYNLDIMHLHTEFSLAKIALAASKELDIPLVYTLHTMYEYYIGHLAPIANHINTDLFWSCAKKVFLKPITKRASMVIVPSMKMFNARRRYEIKDNVTVIPTGIDLHGFVYTPQLKKEADELRESMGLKDKFVCLYLGRVAAEKDISTSMKAFAGLNSNYDTVFLVVGCGPAVKKLKKLAVKLGIEKKVIFTGGIPWSEVPKYYHLADVFLSASVTETQGLTFLEAVVSGVPIIGIKDDCLSYIIENGVSGYLCRDEKEMTGRINTLYKDRKKLAEISANVHLDIEEYSSSTYTKRALALYAQVLNSRKS